MQALLIKNSEENNLSQRNRTRRSGTKSYKKYTLKYDVQREFTVVK